MRLVAGVGSGSQIIEGIQYCANQTDVQIISMSLGTTSASDGQDAMSLAVNCASDSNYRASCNVTPINSKIVVVAAGNSGSAPGTIGAPGAAEKAITVDAAANWSEDGKGELSPAVDRRLRVASNLILPHLAYVFCRPRQVTRPVISAIAVLLWRHLSQPDRSR
ncbi:S8 family serine peptidase [Nitrosomonas sp. Nm132]|uniref:S8 family serine peptidase n=1 Tax=Nitrosomonas sp. Nm132 TaxID=1881053 RepID=UPI00087EEC30|nr:S8 family serine peptidase [Nitrosomonas sp. Nm132]SDH54024.1 Subtilase family protein [Nitrosomonas sp. Nm132]